MRPPPRLIFLLAAVCCAGGCSRQARKARVMARADRDYRAGNYPAAEVGYRKALTLVPYDPDAIRQLGLIYQDEGRVRQAYAYLKKALELAPAAPAAEARAKLAEDELAMGATAQARKTALAALDQDPACQDGLLALVAASRTPAELAAARSRIAEAARREPNAASVPLALGMIDVRSDRSKAKAEFREALARDPRCAPAHAGLANLAFQSGDRTAAAAELKQAAELSPVRSVWRIRRVEFAIQTGRLAEADTQLAELTRQAPDFVAAWLYRMKLAFAEGKLDLCSACVKEVLQRDPGNFDAMMEAGSLALAQDDPKGAINAFLNVDRQYPRLPLVQYQLAMAYLRAREPINAEERLNAALRANPNYGPAALILSELEISQQRPAPAVQRLTRLLRASPRTEQAYLILGRAYLAQKNESAALQAYRTLARLFPRDPQGDYRAGLVYLQEHRPAEARQCFEQAVAIAPLDGPALEMLVDLDLSEKNLRAAEMRIVRLRTEHPQAPAAWLLQAKIDVAEHDMAAAKRDLSRAIALDPNSSTAYFLLARLDLAGHDTAEAEAQLKTLAAKTGNAGAFLQLSALYAAQRQFSQARAELQKALAKDPKLVSAWVNLAWLDSEYLKRPDDAEREARTARDLAPEDPNAARAMGWILVKKGALREGLPLLQESAEELASDPDAQYRLGMAYYYLGDEDLARGAFHRALGLSPDAGIAAAVRTRLGWLDYDPAAASPALQAKLAAQAKAEPNDPVALRRLAATEERSGQAQAAARDYAAALALTPGNAPILLNLAELYAGPLHNPALALENAKAAHVLAPDDPQSALILGRLAARLGEHAWSLDLLRQAERGLPPDASLEYDLAWENFRLGRTSEAEDSLQSAESDPAIARREDVKRFGRLLQAQESPVAAAAAVPDAEAALREDPQNLAAEMVLALAAENANRLAAAAGDYGRMLDQDGSFSPAALRLAVVDFRLGRYDAAAELFHQAARDEQLDPGSRFYYGMSLCRLRRNDEAKAQLETALAGGLPEREAAEARRALRQLK